ncbi:MAG: hypothetical protein RIQ62_1539 [Bacteroidota bacterium]|jgi:lycopene cyclase domain-containing protein
MNTHFSYAWIDLGAIIVPFIFSFHPKLAFYKEWKYYFLPNLAVSLFFIIWDILFTDMGVWHFNPKYITGLSLANLPIEEVMFFFCIPYASVFTYHCLQVLHMKVKWNDYASKISLVLGIFLVMTGILNGQQAYTFSAFVLCGIFLQATHKTQWIGFYLQTYAILLIPFFIVNGLLTGTGLDEAIVQYNPNEFSGIRALTIPAEDFIYGMLLLGLTVWGYERMKHMKR